MTPIKAPFLGIEGLRKKPKKSKDNKTDETKTELVKQNSLEKLKNFFKDGGPRENHIKKRKEEARFWKDIREELIAKDKNKNNDSNDRSAA